MRHIERVAKLWSASETDSAMQPDETFIAGSAATAICVEDQG